jgi:Transposase DDE domain
MDCQGWSTLLCTVQAAARKVNRELRPKRLRFPDWLIVAMYLWAVAHDRPQSWACDRVHYGSLFRPRKLPSVSQFNRRMNEPRTRLILQRVHDELAGPITATALSYLDGKPLPVGVASKDPDARSGHVMGGYAKGYKLHAWMTEDRRIPLWIVMPLNVDERPMAQVLIGQVNELSPRSLILADQNYDTYTLHKMIDARGGRLLVKPKGSADGKRNADNLKKMGAARRELLKVRAEQPDLLRYIHKQRINAESILGNLCGCSGGLTGLPPWVRRLPRVRRWVGGKMILYHAKLRARKPLATAA